MGVLARLAQMLRLRRLVLVPLAAAFAAPALAAPGGKLETLEPGKWYCELPGDAETIATPQPREDFTAVPDSSYRLEDGRTGTYLRLGDLVTLTSGPRDGERFRLSSEAMMHRLDAAGNQTSLRCVRAGDPSAGLVAHTATAAGKPR